MKGPNLVTRLISFLALPFPMAVSLATKFALLTLNFLAILLVAHLYGPTASGQIGLISALLNVTAVCALGGSELLALKKLSGSEPERNEVFCASMVQIFIGIIAVSLVCAIVYQLGLVDKYVKSIGSSLVLVLPLAIGVNAFRVFLFETVRASESIVKYNCLLLTRPFILIGLILYFSFSTPSVNFSWIVILLEFLLLLTVSIYFLINSHGISLIGISWKRLKFHIREARPFYLSSLSVASYGLDILVLGSFVSANALGVYVVTSRIAAIVGLPLVTSSVGYAPRVAQIIEEQGVIAALRYSRKQTRAILKFSILFCIIVSIAGYWTLALLGSEFAEGYGLLAALIGAQMVLAMGGQAGLFLMMSGHEALQRWIFLSAAASIFGLILLLAPILGIHSGPIAVLAGALVRVVLGTFAIQRLFGDGISAVHVVSELCPKVGDSLK